MLERPRCCTSADPVVLLILLQIVQRLLTSAVADPAVGVRRTILQALAKTSALDKHLAQAEALRSLFVALNDESSTVRSLTIRLAGHISAANPAYVMPAMRRHLMQLLSDMDHSPDWRQREGERCASAALAARPAALPPTKRASPAADAEAPSSLHLQRAPGCWACSSTLRPSWCCPTQRPSSRR